MVGSHDAADSATEEATVKATAAVAAVDANANADADEDEAVSRVIDARSSAATVDANDDDDAFDWSALIELEHGHRHRHGDKARDRQRAVESSTALLQSRALLRGRERARVRARARARATSTVGARIGEEPPLGGMNLMAPRMPAVDLKEGSTALDWDKTGPPGWWLGPKLPVNKLVRAASRRRRSDWCGNRSRRTVVNSSVLSVCAVAGQLR